MKTVRNVVLGSIAAVTLTGALATAGFVYWVTRDLPSYETLAHYEPPITTRVYGGNGLLIGEYARERRIFVPINVIPKQVIAAFLSAEDKRFYEHGGLDFTGIVRAVVNNLQNYGKKRPEGASTITQQVAKNFLLSSEQKLDRKLKEAILAIRIERAYSKDKILELYLNEIYLGMGSYGVAAAAETYFGKQLDDLTLGEAATLARVPQWPSRYNPISDPGGATERRAYVLRRMLELGFIDATAADLASKEIVRAKAHRALADVEAPYVAEMARLYVREKFGEKALEAGFKVYTTLDGRLQNAANLAVRMGLVDHDRRHGWRGAQNRVELTGSENVESLDVLLDEYGHVGNLRPAIVISVADKKAEVFVKGQGMSSIEWAGMSWAKRRMSEVTIGPEPKSATEILARGDVIYVFHEKPDAPAELAQVPEAESALIALDPNNGAIMSLVGGFDYFSRGLGKFNRARMAKRQPGSGFKPFMYAAAMAGDFTPATMILDAPIIMDDPNLEEVWRPKNSGGGFRGPMRLREALVQSRNLVSIRLLQQLGVKPVIEYVQNFGFTKMPGNLTLALGSMGATPQEVATGFAVFANGGYKVEPFYIDRIEGPAGQIIYAAEPATVCAECRQPVDVVSDADRAKASAISATHVPPTPVPTAARRTQPAPRVITPQVSFLMNDIMRDVITRGTGRRALALGRSDLRGKTGTTNENVDTWFNGFNDNLVASVWVGYDDNRPLGEGEEGARTAVPIWVDYMREAQRGVPEKPRSIPEGIVEMKINAATGGRRDADLDPLFEYFRIDALPSDEGYQGDMGVSPADIDPSAPNAPQSGSDPIF